MISIILFHIFALQNELNMQRNFYVLITVLLLGFMACTQKAEDGQTTTSKETLDIVTTTGMIGDVVKNIVGDKANVASLMGPGVDPHLYKATQGDLKRITEADVIFYNGLFLEGKMEEILLKLAKKKPVFAISEKMPKSRFIDYNIGKKEERKSKQIFDPHIWFDVDLWSNSVDVILEKMKAQDAKNEAYYTKNAANYKRTLKNLHTESQQKIASIPKAQRLLITSHDAFGYFGKAYDIEVNALQGISTVTEFGLKDVSNLVNMIIDRDIKSVFIESSVAAKPLEAVIEGCQKKGRDVRIGGTLYSDAMGEDGTPAGTYVGMVKHNVNTITGALK